MLELMLPGETVLKALKRLGGGKNIQSASQRWKKKKSPESKDTAKEEEEKANKEKLLKLTGLADVLLQHGDHDIYQDTYEKLQFKTKVAEEKESKTKTEVPEGTGAHEEMDIFADSDIFADGDKKSTEADRGVTSEAKSGESKKNEDAGTDRGVTSETKSGESKKNGDAGKL